MRISFPKRNGGVTIIFALIIFLVASIVSMVIVNSAQANASRLAREKEYEQAYLTTTSLLSYLKGEVAGDSVSFRIKLVEEGDGDDVEYVLPEILSQSISQGDLQYTAGDTNPLSTAMVYLTYQKFTEGNGVTSSLSRAYTMTIDGATVDVKLAISPVEDDYTVTIQLRLLDQDKAPVYSAYAIVGGRISYDEEKQINEIHRHRDPIDGVEQPDIVEIQTTVYRNYTVEWEQAGSIRILKGAVL